MGESRCHGGNATSSTGEKNENTDTGVVNAPTNADKRDIQSSVGRWGEDLEIRCT